MKKNLLFVSALMLIFITNGFSQVTVNTGTMQIYLSSYGKFRILTPDGTRQLDRASILVGTPDAAVYDFNNDVNTILEATTNVANPVLSDFEISGAYGRDASSSLPDVKQKINAYGWTNKAYSIVKFNVTNNAASEITANIGLDIIPQLAGGYEDTITYNSTAGVIRYHFGAANPNMGVKLLSATMTSLYSFIWYDGYEVDADYWSWMNKGTLQPMCASSDVDPDLGTVTITSQAPVTLAPGASVDVYYAFALGADEKTMLSNISAAELQYAAFTTSITERQPSVNGLKNYPNPVKNATKISYELPQDGFVSLRIYDAMGNVAATLVNSKQSSGLHTIDFNAKDLSRGVYSYSLIYNNQVKTRKMIIVK